MRIVTKDDLEYKKYMESRANHKYACKHCGHKQLITNKMEKTVCDWCGKYIFKNGLDEFKYRLNEKQLRKK